MRRVQTALCGLPLVLLLSTAQAWAEARVVKNASLQFITGDDGKDATDVLTISVANANGKILARVFDVKQEIKPGTTFSLWLNKMRAEPSEALTDSKITFRIAPQGDEHWVVREAQLTVNYESGPPEKWRWGPFTLETKDSKPHQVEYPLSNDARVKP